MATKIAEHAVTLVRDEDKLVPLKNIKPELKVFDLAVTNGDDRAWVANSFTSRVETSGLKVETIVLDERSTDAEVQKAIEKALAGDVVLASLYGRVRSGQKLSVGIPDTGARVLSAVITAKKPIVGISFGDPFTSGLSGVTHYLVAYGDMPSLQQAVARALMARSTLPAASRSLCQVCIHEELEFRLRKLNEPPIRTEKTDSANTFCLR